MLRLLAAVLILFGGSQPLWAACLALGGLSVPYAPPWQRGNPEEEARLESAILRHAGEAGSFTLLIPWHHPRLRLPPERYFVQLETIWRFQYGDQAELDWLEVGGRRWRLLRRPSVEREDAVVFQLVTVHKQQAHHVLAYAPKTAAQLPAPVLRLLAEMSAAAPACPPYAPADEVEVAGRSAASSVEGIRPASPAPPAPAAASAPPGWRLTQTLRPRIGPTDIDQLMALEQRALVADGGITGIALEGAEHALKAFIEGFLWEEGLRRRPVKRPFARAWHLTWEPPPQVWPQGQRARLSVRLAAESEPLVLDVALIPLCGPAERLLQPLAGQQIQQADVEERLRDLSAACQAVAVAGTQAELALNSAQAASSLDLMPPDPSGLSQDQPELMVLSLRPRLGAGAGKALLDRAAFHYIYRRQRAAAP